MTTSEVLRQFASARGLRVVPARLVDPSRRERARFSVKLRSAQQLEIFAADRGFIVDGSGFGSSVVFSVGRAFPLFSLDEPLESAETNVGHPVFCHRTLGGRAVLEWFAHADHLAALRRLVRSPAEDLRVFANGIDGYFEASRDLSEIADGCLRVIALLPPAIIDHEPVNLDLLPRRLRALAPLALRYGVTDDAERQGLLESCSPAELEAVRQKVRPLLSAINNYLEGCRDGPDEIGTRIGALAEFVLESERPDA